MKFSEDIRGAIRIGLASARANFVPIIVLWAMAAALVGAYYLLAPFREVLEPVADWHRQWGWKSAFASQAVFCGLLPGLFQLTIRGIRSRCPYLTILAETLWCGMFGIAVNVLFVRLAQLFGNDANWTTLLLKTLVDQFVWTFLVVAPANAVFYFWVGRDFSIIRLRREWPSDFLDKVLLPNLVANWCVWIPACLAVFAFPLGLQLYLNGLICAFWTLMCVQIGVRSGR